jgi:molybdopterin-binding protein
VIVQLAVGRTRLLAAVTRDAVERLGIAEKRRVHALVKSVSLELLVTRRPDRGAHARDVLPYHDA